MEKTSENLVLEKMNSERMQEFIRNRAIKPEDFHLIEKLLTFSKQLIILSLHNLFNLSKERSGAELGRAIRSAERSNDQVGAELYKLMLAFYNKYGWPAGWNLTRVLEEM